MRAQPVFSIGWPKLRCRSQRIKSDVPKALAITFVSPVPRTTPLLAREPLNRFDKIIEFSSSGKDLGGMAVIDFHCETI